MSWRKYIYIYETDVVTSGVKFSLDNVKIETFNDARTFSIAKNLQSVVLQGKETTLAESATLVTSLDHTTLVFTARTKEPNIFDAKKQVIESLDNAVALIGNIYEPTMFDKRIYAGWDYEDPSLIFAEGMVFMTDKIHHIDFELVSTVYQELPKIAPQYSKMAKLYSQAASMPVSEEKFVKLWTILELYPLETEPGKPLELSKLYDLLKRIAGVSQNQINKKLKIHSEIFARYRSEIVHTGTIGFSEIELKDTMARLSAIARVVMRHRLGFDYENELQEFL
ncbi:hypothetical protein EON76_01285 [bacterium]|nr:MAG: hypothetical protein EON76_01285 [bacterium]